MKNWKATKNVLVACFSAERDIKTLTLEDGHQFRKWLDKRRIKKSASKPSGQPMAENAKRKHIEGAKVFMGAAIRRGFITENPFRNLASSTQSNRSRDHDVTLEMTEKIIQACPDAEWRLLVSLWRLAGLRKMEVFNLTWDDVLWDQGKMRVHASKTAHHEGKDIRYVPLRDIKDALSAVYCKAKEGENRIITRFTPSNSNLDKPMKVILHRAGLVPWPKLFQNMRASCETSWLSEGHPAHVVAGWIGHSVKIQRNNYAQITAGHFESFNEREPFGSQIGSVGASTEKNECEPTHLKRDETQKTSRNIMSRKVLSTGGGT